MPTTIPVVPRTVNTGDISRLGTPIEDCFAVVLFGGIGLLATLIAIICDVQGSWFSKAPQQRDYSVP